MTNPYIRPLLRFWPVMTIGLAVAPLAAVLVLYRVGAGMPPTLESRAVTTFAGSMLLMLNSPSNPYVRTGYDTPDSSGASSKDGRDVGALLQAANTLPFLIHSDQVTRIRREMYGQLPGSVTATALFARDTPRGLRPSTIPVIQISTVAQRPRQAIRLARATTHAFTKWLVGRQNAARVPRQQRILVQVIQRAQVAPVTNAPSKGLAFLVFAAVLAGFAVLTQMLERARPQVHAYGRLTPVAPEDGRSVRAREANERSVTTMRRPG